MPSNARLRWARRAVATETTPTVRSGMALPPVVCLVALGLWMLVWAAAGSLPAVAAGSWDWPVEGQVLTAYANGDDPYAAGQHRGIDIAAPVGEPERAATDGTVTFAGGVGSSGLTVGVQTADARFDTSYLHLDSIAVTEGDQVSAGQQLGGVGTTGRRSTSAPHLHFGVRDAGERHAYRDPLDFLARTAGPGPQPPAPIAPPARRQPPEARPAPAPRAVPARPPEPTRRALPGRAPAPVPNGAPALRGVPAAVPEEAVRRSPASRPSRDPGPAPAHRSADRPETAEAPEPSRGPAGVPPPRESGAQPQVLRQPAAVPSARLDIGWLLAAAAFVVALAALLRPASVLRLSRRAASAVGFALRPLTGRY